MCGGKHLAPATRLFLKFSFFVLSTFNFHPNYHQFCPLSTVYSLSTEHASVPVEVSGTTSCIAGEERRIFPGHLTGTKRRDGPFILRKDPYQSWTTRGFHQCDGGFTHQDTWSSQFSLSAGSASVSIPLWLVAPFWCLAVWNILIHIKTGWCCFSARFSFPITQ